MSSPPPVPGSALPAVPRAAWLGLGAGLAIASAIFLAYNLFLAPTAAPRVSAPPPRPTVAPLVVQVAGEVLRPGVYQLSAASRVGDAIEEAGGATADGDPNQLNLAARVSDGQRIAVPRKQVAAPAPTTAPARAVAAPPGRAAGTSSGDVSLALIALGTGTPDVAATEVPEGVAMETPEPATPTPARATATPRPVRTPTPNVRATLEAGGRINLNTATLAELDALPGVGQVTAQKILDQRKKALFSSVEELRDLKLVTNATFQRIKDMVTVG